jgi:hypothetical protein
MGSKLNRSTVEKGRRVLAATFRAAELGRNGAASCLNRPHRHHPVLRLLSPCYAPVPRATALFDQPTENKWFSADYRSQDRAGTGREREKQGETGSE